MFARCLAVLLLVLAAPGARTVAAQSPGARVDFTAPLEQQFAGDLTHLHDKVLALAEAIPADRYSWRPSDQVRTVSQLLMHLAGEWWTLCPMAVGAKPPAAFTPPGPATKQLETIADEPAVLAELRKSWSHCRATG